MSSDLPDTDAPARNVDRVRIEDEMEQSYIDYAMSVIAGRALPDVRDGLKPVHRRLLYAMHEMGVSSGSAHRKSSSVSARRWVTITHTATRPSTTPS
jgi:DNA gyrase subunit A